MSIHTATEPSRAMLVDARWLLNHLDEPGVRVFDCTTHMIAQPVGPSKIVSGKADFERGHIPGATHLDMVADLSDPSGAYPYTMLRPEQFEQLANRTGLKKEDHVILYATSAITTLTRAWLVFYVMGHPNVSILDGGLREWQACGGPIITKEIASEAPHGQTITPSTPIASPGSYRVTQTRLEHIATLEDIKRVLIKHDSVLLNALSREQFEGISGAHYGRPGRIPDSLHLAAREMVEPVSGKFHAREKLLTMAKQAGLDASRPVIHYCGGGIAASTTAFVLAMLGWKDWALYDNSLLEWSTQPDTPMARH